MDVASNDQKQKEQKLANPELEKIFNAESPNAVTFLNVLLEELVKLESSDILFEPQKEIVSIRVRIDGVLYKVGIISTNFYATLISRIKVMSELDLTEKRKVQEGQFTIYTNEKQVNLRVEIAGVVNGEMVVIRIHERRTIIMDLSELGFSPESYQTYQKILQKRSGLILVAGPTGSGKTTTLYSTLVRLNSNNNYNVTTIENPVEFQMDGINQMNVDKENNISFSDGLKTILRLTPDIIWWGK